MWIKSFFLCVFCVFVCALAVANKCVVCVFVFLIFFVCAWGVDKFVFINSFNQILFTYNRSLMALISCFNLASFSISVPTFVCACMAVVWSRPPSSFPMAG